MKLAVLLLAAAGLLAGCSTLDTHLEPKADLSQLKHVWVQQSLNDNHGLDAMIVRELQSRGIQAESGPLTLMPLTARRYIIYQDQWDWDFKDYLISLGLTVRDAHDRSDHGDGQLFSAHGLSAGVAGHGAPHRRRAVQTNRPPREPRPPRPPPPARKGSRPFTPSAVTASGDPASFVRMPTRRRGLGNLYRDRPRIADSRRRGGAPKLSRPGFPP